MRWLFDLLLDFTKSTSHRERENEYNTLADSTNSNENINEHNGWLWQSELLVRRLRLCCRELHLRREFHSDIGR
jgi:hypothetical protein